MITISEILIQNLFGALLLKKTESTVDYQLVPLVVRSLRILVVTLGILFILKNFGYDITSLLAGLGLGGLAFALAAQDTVGNLFGSITVFFEYLYILLHKNNSMGRIPHCQGGIQFEDHATA